MRKIYVTDTYNTFCDRVIAAIPRATEKEEQEIREELLDHLEDRVLDMMERDWSEAEAAERAVASMGDPAEIGRAWNDQLSPFWLWVGRLAKTATILLLCIALLPALARFRGVFLNLEARWSDLDRHRYGVTDYAVKHWTLDERVEMGDYHIRFFQAALGDTGDGYSLRVRSVIYPNNPLYDTTMRVMDGISGDLLGEGWRVGGGATYSGAVCYYDYFFDLGNERPEVVNMSTTNDHGSFSVDFAIDWSGVSW